MFVCVCACACVCVCVWVFMCVCVCVCLSLASDSSETVKVIIVKLGTVTASDMRMHHVLITLTMTLYWVWLLLCVYVSVCVLVYACECVCVCVCVCVWDELWYAILRRRTMVDLEEMSSIWGGAEPTDILFLMPSPPWRLYQGEGDEQWWLTRKRWKIIMIGWRGHTVMADLEEMGLTWFVCFIA